MSDRLVKDTAEFREMIAHGMRRKMKVVDAE